MLKSLSPPQGGRSGSAPGREFLRSPSSPPLAHHAYSPQRPRGNLVRTGYQGGWRRRIGRVDGGAAGRWAL